MGTAMRLALAHARRIAVNPAELARLSFVGASALALIMAGRAFPF